MRVLCAQFGFWAPERRFGEIRGRPAQRLVPAQTDMEAVRREIEARTDALAGSGKDICATPVVLRLHVAGARAAR